MIELAAAIRAGELSPVTVTDHYLRRTQVSSPHAPGWVDRSRRGDLLSWVFFSCLSGCLLLRPNELFESLEAARHLVGLALCHQSKIGGYFLLIPLGTFHSLEATHCLIELVFCHRSLAERDQISQSDAKILFVN